MLRNQFYTFAGFFLAFFWPVLFVLLSHTPHTHTHILVYTYTRISQFGFARVVKPGVFELRVTTGFGVYSPPPC